METILERESKTSTKKSKKYQVIFFNDDTTTFNCVVQILQEVFKKDTFVAKAIAQNIHTNGKAIVAEYNSEAFANKKKNEAIAIARKQGFMDFKVEVQ